MDDDLVTLYAGPLDGLAVLRSHLDNLVQDHGTERFLLLTRSGVSGLYQEVAGRWVYATPHLLETPEHPPSPPEGDGP
ncbi:hypothetical protein [Thermobifida cellulosilytica]|uniref:Uncharacterized protein n=1 Tax=Thermobifida cellulosilytica TB100 TaxID=665004 RepID=A0A147KEN2_THECS|nr:hypothetical protein [Thermobifida cellulosilytica]KUP95766.1 hypothetical protein AC529_15785 [Thermobifida cellulosilytica TB100]